MKHDIVNHYHVMGMKLLLDMRGILEKYSVKREELQ